MTPSLRRSSSKGRGGRSVRSHVLEETDPVSTPVALGLQRRKLVEEEVKNENTTVPVLLEPVVYVKVKINSITEVEIGETVNINATLYLDWIDRK